MNKTNNGWLIHNNFIGVSHTLADTGTPGGDNQFKTTSEHFDQFVKYCKEFITLFGLTDWFIDFAHTEQDEGFLAECGFSTNDQHRASIRLSTTWADEITPNELRRTAFHEVCHVLLADSYNAACCDDLSFQQTISATQRAHHAIIRRLENACLKGK